MSDDFLGQQIRRTNRNLLLVAVVFIGMVAAGMAMDWRTVSNCVFGPFPTDASNFGAGQGPDFQPIPDPNSKEPPPDRFYFKVQGQQSFDTNTEIVEAGHPNHVIGEIVALVMDKHVLLVKTPSYDPHQVQFKGTVSELPWDAKSRIEQEWYAKHPRSQGEILPYVLNATGIWNSDRITGAVLAAVFLGVAFLSIGTSVRRRLQPQNHPLFSRLAQYGPPEDVRMRIDSELRGEGGGEKFGLLHITSNWLVNAGVLKTIVMAAPDIVWVYEKLTRYRSYGITAAKLHSVTICDSKGQWLGAGGKRDSILKLLESMQRRMPWILVGYSDELERLWRRDRPKFLEMVEKRRGAIPTV